MIPLSLKYWSALRGPAASPQGAFSDMAGLLSNSFCTPGAGGTIQKQREGPQDGAVSKELAVQPHDLNLVQDYMGGEEGREAGREGKRERTYTSCPLTTTCPVLHEQPSTKHIPNKYMNGYKNVELFLFPPLTTMVSQ